MKTWTESDEKWWIERVAGFPGGIENAIWHMPDSAAERMAWLEGRITTVSADAAHLNETLELIGKQNNELHEKIAAQRGELCGLLQQFVNGVETGLIASDADEALSVLVGRTKQALLK